MYAKKVIAQWRESSPETQFFGVGDKEMQSQGMDCQGLAEDLAVVGLQEVVSHWTEIKTTFNEIVARAERDQPRFALLLDYPGFNLRLAKKLKEAGIPVVYYISPQLWAWKKGRVEQVRRYVDHMLVVFPFEVDFYKNHGIQAHFVGHPLVEVVADESVAPAKRKSDKTVLGLMPGSRKSEIKFNFLNQLQAARKLVRQHELEVKILVAPTLDIDQLKIDAGPNADGFNWIQGKPTEMINQCDVLLSASGTATLQVALCEKPMVVMYRMNSITAFFARLLVRSVDAFCIVNLVAGKKIVPELFQKDASPHALTAAISKILTDSRYREQMLEDIKAVKSRLGRGGATDNVVTFLKGLSE